MIKSIDFCQVGHEVIHIEHNAIGLLFERIDANFQTACELMLNCTGRIVVMGMGKSGHIAKKIAATLASTGTPAFFVHPAEACHGDLGMITSQDVVLTISYSGETEEILYLLPLIRLFRIPLIAMTGNPTSRLGQAAFCHLNVSVNQEACPLGLAPTASTTATLVMGDALAISLLRARGFNHHDFARFHPSGSLGRRLLMSAADIMHKNEQVPQVTKYCPIVKALLEMTQKRLGMTTVVDENNQLIGVFTDGDLRRALDKGFDIHQTPIVEAMTHNCTTITPSLLAVDALTMMRTQKITALPVIDEARHPIGVVHMHDLLQAGVV
ncbi:MAG: D-arabinose 5-phosphate isomerase [Coxiella sp. RIFCSPHIGHO2_12_FULL_44_14]|nr:MAG: D-arabinose 5-phosphate isomerase [Coxiella sp. RIFCSPHIGHO2_12_FULL_44_14]